MKNALRDVWIAVGIVLLGVLIATGIHVNMVIGDIRAVSDSVTMEDIRHGMNIIEKQLDLELMEKGR